MVVLARFWMHGDAGKRAGEGLVGVRDGVVGSAYSDELEQEEKKEQQQQQSFRVWTSIPKVFRRKSTALTSTTSTTTTTTKEKKLARSASSARGDWVPSLSAILKAGDEGIVDSSLFEGLEGDEEGVVRLEALFGAFADEIAKAKGKVAVTSEMSRFVARMRRDKRRSYVVAARTSFDRAEKGLGRRKSKKEIPVLAPLHSGGNGLASENTRWADDVQHAKQFDGRMAVTVTKAELAALSLVLGSPVGFPSTPSGSGSGIKTSTPIKENSVGAYGLSLTTTPIEDGRLVVQIRQHIREIGQMPARSSSSSILWAKYLACGALPLSSSSSTTEAILITNDMFDAVLSGAPLTLNTTNDLTPAATFLTKLPHSKRPGFYTLTPSQTSSIGPTATTSAHLPLVRSIAALPFRHGLVPLASPQLISTISFIASGGLVPGRLLQRLDMLLDKVHRHSPSLSLFGPLFETQHTAKLIRERERLGRIAVGENNEESTADKAARIGRYQTLTERLLGMLVETSKEDEGQIVAQVRADVERQIERAYQEAVAVHRNQGSPPATPTRNLLRRGTKRSKRSSTASVAVSVPPASPPLSATYGPRSPAVLASPRASLTFPPENLGQLVEDLLKQSLPFDLASVALVVRLVIVGWTLSVKSVNWEAEEGFAAFEGSEVSREARDIIMV